MPDPKPAPPDPAKSRSAKSTPTKSSAKGQKKLPFSTTQLIILGVLVAGLCGVVIVFGGLLVFGSGPSPGSAAVVEVATAPPALATSTPPPPEPTATPTPSPEPIPTAEPSPTATMVVPPVLTNKDTINDITKFVEQLRELSLPAPLPINFLTRDQLRSQWGSESVDGETIAAIQTQQAFYATMGLIEPDVDLVQAAFESNNDTLLGYYTPEDKVMFIIAESVNMFAQEKITFAHEYTHALQDHYFDLGALLARGGSADAKLAARALPEGDAHVVDQLFANANITQDQLDYAVYRYLFEDHPDLEGVSPALGILTYFPYSAGQYFIIYLYTNGGYSWDKVNAAYSNPPISTEQVLHPEKYLAGEVPTPVDIPDLAPALGPGWREIDRNVLGEIGLLVWLIDKAPEEEATQAAAGWDGDSYSLWTDEQNRGLLVERSIWESEAEAGEFVFSFTTYMNLRESRNARADEGQTLFWVYDGGLTMVEQRGREVLIIVAPDRATLDQTRSLF